MCSMLLRRARLCVCVACCCVELACVCVCVCSMLLCRACVYVCVCVCSMLLHRARLCVCMCVCVCSMLLRRGADSNREDTNKCVPVFLARRLRYQECAQIITQFQTERVARLAREAAEVSTY